MQDVWPFSFGFDATRAAVARVYGPPREIQRRDLLGAEPGGTQAADEDETTAFIEERRYAGVVFEFFVSPSGAEMLLSVRLVDNNGAPSGAEGAEQAEPLPRQAGELHLGMLATEAGELLGEPQAYRPGVGDSTTLGYFYASNSIILTVNDGRVTEIQLARALP